MIFSTSIDRRRCPARVLPVGLRVTFYKTTAPRFLISQHRERDPLSDPAWVSDPILVSDLSNARRRVRDSRTGRRNCRRDLKSIRLSDVLPE